MEIHVFAPYVVALSPRLVNTLQVKPNEAVCFAITKDANDNPKGLWIGKETIFTSTQSLSYPLHRNHIHGFDGFSAKLLVYEMNLNPGAYKVNPEARFCKNTGIDWFKVDFENGVQRNWRAIESHPVKKIKRISLENNGDI